MQVTKLRNTYKKWQNVKNITEEKHWIFGHRGDKIAYFRSLF